jgi:hypothetical protein
MANVIVCPALHATSAAEVYIGAGLRAGFVTLFILGSELAGFGLAGLGRRVLVSRKRSYTRTRLDEGDDRSNRRP